MDWYNLAADNGMQMYTVLDVGKVLTLPKRGEAPHAPMPLQSPYAPTSAAVTSAQVTSVAASSTPVYSSQPAAVAAPAPAYVSTSNVSSFEQCVISRESGGNAQVMNGSGHWGLFQFSQPTWVAYGGSASAFGSASAGAQQQVFNNAMARGGQSNWSPYDGC